MRLHRFYVIQPLGEEVVIDDVSLVSQWTKVFRYSTGDFVILFNGDGYDYSYSLTTISKSSSTLHFEKRSPSSYNPKRNIALCLSVIKKDNFELVVEKATELGVTTIIPILSTRSEKKNLSMERLRKISTEASEQCGRGSIPTLKNITTLSDIVSTISNHSSKTFCFNMGGQPISETGIKSLNNSVIDTIYIFIGPEGGWSSDDLDILRGAGVQEYSLGSSVLRAETAAIVACATFYN